jgi:hypothetical protein
VGTGGAVQVNVLSCGRAGLKRGRQAGPGTGRVLHSRLLKSSCRALISIVITPLADGPSQILLEKRQLRVKRANAKTDASARFIELNRDATEAASRLLIRANLLGAKEPDDFLMPKCLSNVSHGPQKGQRGYDPKQHQAYWDTAWRSLTSEAGLSGFRFHDLRHTFITQMHSDLRWPYQHQDGQHYTHISTGAAKDAVAKFDADPILVTVRKPQIPATVQ